MGVVKLTIQVLSPADGRRKVPRCESLEVLVDTGATLTALPAKMLKSLGVKPVEKIKIRIGDGRLIRRDSGDVRLRIDGRTVWSRVIFGKRNDPAVLGLTTLGQLGLTVDPIRRRLVPAEILLL